MPLSVPLTSFFNDVKICVTSYFMYGVSHERKYCTKFLNQYNFICSKFCLLWCSSHYGTAMEHMSLLNRSGICDGIICCNIYFFHTAVLSKKIAFNLVKIHLLFRIILLIQWSLIFSRPCCYRIRETEIYTPSVFRIYSDIHGWTTNGICVTN